MSQGVSGGDIGGHTPISSDFCVIALGSNLKFGGLTPEKVLEAALKALLVSGFVIRDCSRIFTTPAFPAGSGPDFANAVAIIETPLNAAQTLAQLHAVEAEFERIREARWMARTLDLDLIACGDLVLPDAQTHRYWRDMPLETQKTATPQELVLPHPRLAERAFVLVPMMDVAPDWQHPVTQATVRQMHEALPRAQRDVIVELQ